MKTVLNVVRLVLAGWWPPPGRIVTGVAPCATIAGIPPGIADFRLTPVSPLPLGKEIVPGDRPFAGRW